MKEKIALATVAIIFIGLQILMDRVFKRSSKEEME